MPDQLSTAEPHKPGRRWFQFRLRTLLVGAATLALVYLVKVSSPEHLAIGVKVARIVVFGLAGLEVVFFSCQFHVPSSTCFGIKIGLGSILRYGIRAAMAAEPVKGLRETKDDPPKLIS
ncbi:MAG TPA: hypothetical protein VGI75_06725 [Pirellulales bacterium]